MTAVKGPVVMSEESPPTPSRTSSDVSGEESNGNKAGTVSPASVRQPRRLSSRVITATTEETHEYVEGRTTIVVPAIETTLDGTPKKQKAPNSGPLLASTTKTPSRTESKPLLAHKPPQQQPPRRLTSEPIETKARPYLTVPHPLSLQAWTEPAADSFKVRGPRYLVNNKKVASDSGIFHLLSVDLVKGDKPMMTGICAHPKERIQMALVREAQTGAPELPPFIFCVNLAIPGPPYFHLVSYFGINDIQELKTPTTPFGLLANKFFFGEDDKFRDETFKLIPRIVEGNMLVKKAVGTKPTIIGQKLNQIYIRDSRFLELIIDIGSDAVAEKIVKLCVGYAKTLIVDMAFVLEGKHPKTLPERVMGSVRMKNLDFKEKNGQKIRVYET